MAKEIFKHGTRAKNERGWYTVQADPVQGKMTVRYDSGAVAMLMTALELTNYRLSQKCNPTIKRDEDYYIAKGFLAGSAFVLIKMPQEKVAEFKARYAKNHPNVELADEYLNGFQVVENWGIQLTINFDKRLFDCIPCLTYQTLTIERNNDPESTACQINNNDWINELLDMGFGVGTAHDVEQIRKNVPEAFLEAFQVGLEFAAELPNASKEKSIYFQASGRVKACAA